MKIYRYYVWMKICTGISFPPLLASRQEGERGRKLELGQGRRMEKKEGRNLLHSGGVDALPTNVNAR